MYVCNSSLCSAHRNTFSLFFFISLIDFRLVCAVVFWKMAGQEVVGWAQKA